MFVAKESASFAFIGWWMEDTFMLWGLKHSTQIAKCCSNVSHWQNHRFAEQKLLFKYGLMLKWYHDTLANIGQHWKYPTVASVGRISVQCLEWSLDHSKCISQVLKFHRISHTHYGFHDQGLHGVTDWKSLRNNLFVVKQTVSRVLMFPMMGHDMFNIFVKCYCTVKLVSRSLKLLFHAYNC